MCRILAYTGKSIRLKHLLLDPEHSLEVQSYAPKEMLEAQVNVDGFGCGWYNHDIASFPGVYTSLNNLWSDKSFQSISKIISSDQIFASVRNATPPSPVDEQSIQPFTKGPYMFMHNGHIKKYHRKLKRTLNDLIPDDLYTTLYSHADSATIFLLLFDKLRNGSPTLENMTRSLLDTVYLIAEYAAEAEVICYLNLALTNGKDILFTRYSNTDESNTLYYLKNGEAFPESVVIASEPLNDDAGWQSLSHNYLLTVSASGDINTKKIES